MQRACYSMFLIINTKCKDDYHLGFYKSALGEEKHDKVFFFDSKNDQIFTQTVVR